MKLSKKKIMDSNLKQLEKHFNALMTLSSPSAEEALKTQPKKLVTEGVSCEQIYQQIAAPDKFYLSEDLKNINLESFACRIYALKSKLQIESDQEEDNSEVEFDEDDAQSDVRDEENDMSGDELSEFGSNSEDEEQTDEESKASEVEKEPNPFENGVIDFDADTFGDIVLETDGSEDEDVDNEDFDKLPTEMDEETKNIMYDDFFDDGVDDNEGANAKFSDFFGNESKGEKEEEEDDDDNENDTPNKIKSTFEKAEDEDRKLMREMESENLGEKPWFLTGEVTKQSRPEYSVLEEHLDFRTTASQKPISTEDLNKKIEDMILKRISRKAFDSPVRTVKPLIEPNDYRQKYKVDETKSKKSLADIYVEDFMKKREGTNKETPAFLLTGYVAPKDESDIKKELRFKIADLFRMLDGMCNKHHTPYLTRDENKIESKSAALSVEEATPITTSDAMMLAPEEVMPRTKGDLKGQTEKSTTDRKRERRRKRKYQREQGKQEEDNLNKQLKKPTSKSAQEQASLQFVQKAVKRGHVKVLPTKERKGMKTSTQFFTALEDRQETAGEPSKKKRKTK